MQIILDRIEKDANGKRIAVFEVEEKMINICEDNAPCDFFNSLYDGVVVEAELDKEKIISYRILDEETKARKERIKNKLNNLFGRKN